MMREKMGLQSKEIWGEDGKNRADHRHHAIDAFVVGCTTRSILQRVSTEAKNQENKKQQNEDRQGLIDKMPDPFEGYFSQVKEHFDRLVVSHKPDRGSVLKNVKENKTIAKLHEDTAYGLIDKSKSKGKSVYVTRKPIASIESIKDIEKIADEKIRDRLLYAVEDVAKNEFKGAVEEEANRTWQTNIGNRDTPPVKKVRIHIEKSDDVMIPIKSKKDGEEYKYYQGGGNLYTDIFVSEHKDIKDKATGKVKYKKDQWYSEIVSNYAAHQYARKRVKNPNEPDCEWKKEIPMAKRVMRLYKNDMVAYEKDGKRIICRVKKMSQDGRVWLIPHKIAKEEKDGDSTLGAPASKLQEKNARKIKVDILGKVWDPGPYKSRSKSE